jgi:hypothetical protein
MDLPRQMREIKDPVKQEGVWRRENIFKNVIMRRINEIRLVKKKPKFSDMLKSMKGKDLSDPKVKADFKKRMLALYDDEVEEAPEQDMKYEKLMSSFDRI